MICLFYVFIVMWAASAILSYGLSFAYFQRKFSCLAKDHYYADMVFCLLTSVVGGPVALCTWGTFVLDSKRTTGEWYYGFKFY